MSLQSLTRHRWPYSDHPAAALWPPAPAPQQSARPRNWSTRVYWPTTRLSSRSRAAAINFPWQRCSRFSRRNLSRNDTLHYNARS